MAEPGLAALDEVSSMPEEVSSGLEYEAVEDEEEKAVVCRQASPNDLGLWGGSTAISSITNGRR